MAGFCWLSACPYALSLRPGCRCFKDLLNFLSSLSPENRLPACLSQDSAEKSDTTCIVSALLFGPCKLEAELPHVCNGWRPQFHGWVRRRFHGLSCCEMVSMKGNFKKMLSMDAATSAVALTAAPHLPVPHLMLAIFLPQDTNAVSVDYHCPWPGL